MVSHMVIGQHLAEQELSHLQDSEGPRVWGGGGWRLVPLWKIAVGAILILSKYALLGARFRINILIKNLEKSQREHGVPPSDRNCTRRGGPKEIFSGFGVISHPANNH